jgi:Tfp pilus assembly protein PilO
VNGEGNVVTIDTRIRLVGWVAAALALVAAVFASWRLAGTSPTSSRVGELQEAVRSRSAVLQDGPAVRLDVSHLREAVDHDARRVPREVRLDQFLAAAGRSARAAGVRVVQLQPGDLHSTVDGAVLPVHVSVNGSFEHVYDWMIRLENGAPFSRVNALHAARNPGGGVRADIDIGLVAAGPGASR